MTEDSDLQCENRERLARVGPGTPGGELLRRGWQPIALKSELDESPMRSVRPLGEDLVLFRATSGVVGLLGERCAHEGALLTQGWVDRRGLVCPFHRWLFDADGNCFIVPGAPPGIPCHPTLRQIAYPVQEFMRMYWAYLGPLPAPDIRRIVSRVEKDRRPLPHRLPCQAANWLVAIGGRVDSAHPPLPPNLRWGDDTVQIDVPVDDAHTQAFVVEF